MTRIYWSCIYVIAIALVVSQQSIGGESVGYMTYQTEQGIQLSVPKSWRVFSLDQRHRLDSSTEKLIGQPLDGSLAFSAETYDKTGARIAFTSLRFYPAETITQYEVRQQTSAVVAMVKAYYSDNLETQRSRGNITEYNLSSVRSVELGNHSAIEIDYTRTTFNGDRSTVRLLKIFDGERSFTFTFSYREDAAFSMIPIREAVTASLRRK
jgi:hypothetical protein